MKKNASLNGYVLLLYNKNNVSGSTYVIIGAPNQNDLNIQVVFVILRFNKIL